VAPAVLIMAVRKRI